MDLAELVAKVIAGTWPERVAAIRSVPAEFPGKEHTAVYAEAGRAFYVDKLALHFHLIPWPAKFADRASFFAGYAAADAATHGFTQTTPADIEAAIRSDSRALRIFRLATGYTPGELADTVEALEGAKIGSASIDRMESGGQVSTRIDSEIPAVARLISDIVSGHGGYSVSSALAARGFRGKIDKPDTRNGWASVEHLHREGVPYAELLYQRFYGGAFRQLQDAGGTSKGDLLEDATEALFTATRFHSSVQPQARRRPRGSPSESRSNPPPTSSCTTARSPAGY